MISPNQIFNIKSAKQFEELALQVFQIQSRDCEVYHSYLNALKFDVKNVKSIALIPFLPIEFFKTHIITTLSPQLQTLNNKPQTIFTSSGTTGVSVSKHHVIDPDIYRQSFLKGFELFYGDIKKYCILALLPSYQEREGSSLIYMVEELMKQSGHADSGFYLNNTEQLAEKLVKLEQQDQPVILFGVTFALIDFADQYKIEIPKTVIIETGGMKGRKKEMVREEVHQLLKSALQVPAIHSEYGMTELLSQAYSKGDGLFKCPPWMQVLIRDVNDPFSYVNMEKAGGINIVDLANINSCSFIATQDLGKEYDTGSFEVLGRFDNSDLRGCNLLVG